MGNMWNAYTDRDSVVYYGIAPSRDAGKAASLLTDMFQHPAVSGPRVKQELAAVENEMIYGDGSLRGEEWHIGEQLLFGTNDKTNNVIGTRKNVESATTKDLKAYHDKYFVGKNTVALVEGDPKHLPLETLRKELGKLPVGSRVNNNSIHPSVVPGQSIQAVNDTSSGTVRINAMLPVPTETLAGLKTPAKLITSSLGEALNNRLRRYDHLTYGAGVSLDPADETTSPTNFVLSATADVAPENAKHAMTDLVKTLKDARDGFGDKTFEANKQQYLARIRAQEPNPYTVSERAEDAFQDALLSPGVEIPEGGEVDMRRSMAARVGAIDAKQFAQDAGSLIDLSNMKVLAVGPVGDGADLRSGIREAGLDTAGIKMNPVDLSYYKDMGIAVPKGVTTERKTGSDQHPH
jgi:predicted Zn-dependent peptidase